MPAEGLCGNLATLLGFGAPRLRPRPGAILFPRVGELYRDHPDSGVHGAAWWLLRKWGQQKALAEIEQASRERKRPENRRWEVNSQGQTMVLIPGPVEFLMGSNDYRDETSHRRRISRNFAIAAREVSVAEFQRSKAPPTEIVPYGKPPQFKQSFPVRMSWKGSASDPAPVSASRVRMMD